MNAALEQMLDTWSNGGWVMAALAVLAFIAYATAARLLMMLHHHGLTRVTDSDIRRWVVDPSQAPRHLHELVRYTQDDVRSLRDVEGRFREVEAVKVTDADRRLVFLKILVVSAPLFGLLGTVLGMLLTFRAIGIGGSSTADVIAKGISEALVATQTGMMVAIPGLLMVFLAKRWRNEYVAFLARLEGITLRHFRPSFHGMTRQFVRDATQSPAEPPQAAANSVDETLSQSLPA